MELPKELKPNTEIIKMMEELGCTGKHIKPKDITDRIVAIEFQVITLCGTKMMYCGIAMKGKDDNRPFVVVGEPSVCIDPDNWRENIGHQVSFNNSFDEIYKLEAYRMVAA